MDPPESKGESATEENVEATEISDSQDTNKSTTIDTPTPQDEQAHEQADEQQGEHESAEDGSNDKDEGGKKEQESDSGDKTEEAPVDKKKPEPPVEPDDEDATFTKVVFEDLRFERPLRNSILHATILEKITQYWPNSKQVRVMDTKGDARSVFFYVDEPEPNFTYDDFVAGNVLVIRRPKLHYFMDGQVGMRVEEGEYITIQKGSVEPTDRVAYAEAEKATGTGYFKNQKWEMAVERYEAAARHIDMVPSEGDAEIAGKKAELGSSIHCNIALCLSKQNKYTQVVEYCTKAIDYKATAKAHFRMGQAQEAMRELEAAVQNYSAALKIEPNDMVIKKAHKKVRLEISQRNAKEKAMWGGVFASEPSSSPKSLIDSASQAWESSGSANQPRCTSSSSLQASSSSSSTMGQSSWMQGLQSRWGWGVGGMVGAVIAVAAGVYFTKGRPS